MKLLLLSLVTCVLPVTMWLCGGVSCEMVSVRGEERKWEWRMGSQRGRNLHASEFERKEKHQVQVWLAQCDFLFGFALQAVHCAQHQYSLWTVYKSYLNCAKCEHLLLQVYTCTVGEDVLTSAPIFPTTCSGRE